MLKESEFDWYFEVIAKPRESRAVYHNNRVTGDCLMGEAGKRRGHPLQHAPTEIASFSHFQGQPHQFYKTSPKKGIKHCSTD